MPIIGYFVWAFSLVLAFLLGYRFRDFQKRIEVVEQAVKQKIDKPKEVEPPSLLIDPLDEVQTAIYEAEKMQKRLNGIQ